VTGLTIQRKTQPRLRQAQISLTLFEIAFVLVRFNHIARSIVNPNHGIM
jgi:hypothetical protein